MKDFIIAEYDYYTLEQARKIIFAEEKRRKKKIIESYIAIAIIYIFPFMLFLHWLIVGY